MISFSAFSDELEKIALEGLRPLGKGDVGVQVRLPIINRLPKDPDKARARLIKAVQGKNVLSVLGYKNVVVPEKAMPDMKAMGFRPTRIATPLPGERLLSTSYRAGRLHAHKIGPAYFVHQDKSSPTSDKGSYFSFRAISHGLREGIPSIIKRMRDRSKLVVGVTT